MPTSSAARGDQAERGQALSLSARSTAQPEDAESGTEEGAVDGAEPAGVDAPAPDTIDAALERGDLSAARSIATKQREANPSAANWRTEAQTLEHSGDLSGAAAAYRAHIDALPKDAAAAREAGQADLARVEAQARGTVEGEPGSTHRNDLDARWAAPAPVKKQKKKFKPPPPVVDVPDDRVVNKWYFWVTIGAIAASAAAVTAIAIRASRQEQPDALGLQRAPTRGPTMLRF